MPTVTQEVMITLCSVLQPLPVGTNLALLHMMWMLVSGKLLNSRGAIFPGLLSTGISAAEIRRAWAALRYGSWRIEELLVSWREYVVEQGKWLAHTYEGYRIKAVDLTAFWRPQLKGNPSKHYNSQAGKALPAIVLGIIDFPEKTQPRTDAKRQRRGGAKIKSRIRRAKREKETDSRAISTLI